MLGLQTTHTDNMENNRGPKSGWAQRGLLASFLFFFFSILVCTEGAVGSGGWGGAASVGLSYLRVDLKDRALCGEKRRESCELTLDGLLA